MMARTIKTTINKNNLKEKLKMCSNLLSRVRQVSVEPQNALPDIFVWLISNNKRVAYHRIPAKDIIFSIVDEEKGKDCAHLQTIFLQVGKLVLLFCIVRNFAYWSKFKISNY